MQGDRKVNSGTIFKRGAGYFVAFRRHVVIFVRRALHQSFVPTEGITFRVVSVAEMLRPFDIRYFLLNKRI